MEQIVRALNIRGPQLSPDQHAAPHPQRQAEQCVEQIHRRGQIGHRQAAAAYEIAHQRRIYDGGQGDTQ